jgi:hypothetical protein
MSDYRTDDDPPRTPPERFAGGESFLLRLKCLPSDYPPIARVKRALKQLYRQFDLKCIEILDTTRYPDGRLPTAVPVDEGEETQ